MVQFPGFRCRKLCIHSRLPALRQVGYPIRLSQDLGIFAPPLSFSQLIAAFLAGELLGILHWTLSRLTILSFYPSLYYCLLQTILLNLLLQRTLRLSLCLFLFCFRYYLTTNNVLLCCLIFFCYPIRCNLNSIFFFL